MKLVDCDLCINWNNGVNSGICRDCKWNYLDIVDLEDLFEKEE